MQIEILTELQKEQLQSIIHEANNIVVCCHRRPDGDAVGSSLAWAEYLRLNGKNPVVVVPDGYPDFLRWLPGTETVVRHDRHTEKAETLFHDADVVFCMDFNTENRVGDLEKALHDTPAKKVLIDHHLSPDVDTVLTISHPEMSSTCELVFRLVWQLGGYEKTNRNFAIPLYCGMMTDTGGFTYNSNSPEIFYMISKLLEKGIDKDKIYRNVYNNYSEWRMRLTGYVLYQKLNVMRDMYASYFTLSREDLKTFHFIRGDAEGLVNMPLQIKGMKVSVSLREDSEKDNLIWVSLRSVDDFPCNEMAGLFFNGGGHLNASGGKLECSLEEAEQIVRRAFDYYADKLKIRNKDKA